MNTKRPVLQISNLSVTFRNENEVIRALHDFSCSLFTGECTAVIGESGCGKSVAAHAILKLFPDSTELTGSIQFDSQDLMKCSESALKEIRGKKIGIIYQNPDRSLNPIYTIERQMKEPFYSHDIQIPGNGKEHFLRTLRRVGFLEPEQAMKQYPCQNSGGMNQRAATAVVLGLMPEIVIADEPTKGLDKERLSDIESCLMEIKKLNRSLLLITHDILLAERIANYLIVMYAGQIVEAGPGRDVLSSPAHPYTKGLLKSLPKNGFLPIEGTAPPLSSLPQGCRFANRCDCAAEICIHTCPDIVMRGTREVRCHLC